MPSGAKRRKAAKKKKEKQTHNSSEIHSHGDDDLRVHDEKDSDGGDTGSPASQDHHNHQHPFTEGEEEEMEKREDASSVRSIIPDGESVVGLNGNGESTQKVAMEGNGIIQIDWELKPEDDSDGENVSREYIESVKESNGGHKSQDGGSSSCSSSSDDEAHIVEKNVVVIESGESKEDAPYLVAETAGFPDLIETADLPEVTEVTDDVPVMDAYNLAVAEPEGEAFDPVAAKEDAPYLVVGPASFSDPVKTADLPELTQDTDGVPVTNAYSLPMGETKEDTYNPVAAHAFAVESVDTADLPEVSQVTDSVLNIEAYSLVIEEPSISVVDTIHRVDSENVSKEVVHVNDNAPMEDRTGSSDNKFGLKENGKNESWVSSVVMETGSQPKEDKVCPTPVEYSAVEVVHVNDSVPVEKPPTCSSNSEFELKENGKDDSSGFSPVGMDTGSQPKEDKVSSTALEYSAVSSVSMGSAAQDEEDRLTLSSSLPAVDTSNGTEHAKDSVATEESATQPLVVSAPRPVQRTSWNSCCGLLELFTGFHS